MDMINIYCADSFLSFVRPKEDTLTLCQKLELHQHWGAKDEHSGIQLCKSIREFMQINIFFCQIPSLDISLGRKRERAAELAGAKLTLLQRSAFGKNKKNNLAKLSTWDLWFALCCFYLLLQFGFAKSTPREKSGLIKAGHEEQIAKGGLDTQGPPKGSSLLLMLLLIPEGEKPS